MKNTTLFPIVGMVLLIAVAIGGMFYINGRKAAGQAETTTNQTTGKSEAPAPTSTLPASDINQAVERAITLTITAPTDKAEVETPTIAVSGKTVAYAEVSVNDKDAKADASGNFSIIVSLEEGENSIMVVANDDAGNAAEREIIVTYVPAE